ncbi:hypothetical protein CDL12_20918 [Handroanthus impetiginosus]|uniref:Uncharacterized protein n=1 Tax=Handroanthus impetiginosus TaxID=429701 RepID=A0A2G9GMP7_9LAMI|nr:hypothetical protein CDL12_20918 [Handroanthus impetiginosus]
MDLPLWDLSDGQAKSNYVGDVWQCGHYSGYGPIAHQSDYYIGDHWLCDFSFGYGHDMIEEDALNEKSCIQVLRILMDEADEEIIKLEEDITMLRCQLGWDDEDLSKPCSAALREKIEHLDILIHCLKKEVTEDVHDFSIYLEQPHKLPQRLHDLVKPLLENYFLVKSNQTENGISHVTDLIATGLGKMKSVANTSKSKKKVEAKECIDLLKKNQTKSLFVEPEERKINHHQQNKDVMTRKFVGDGEPYEKDINKLNRLQGKSRPGSAPVKSGKSCSIKSRLSNPLVKDSNASTSTEKAGSREMDERRNIDKETITKAKVTQCELALESKVTNSRLELQEMETDISDTVKPADVILLDTRIDLVKQRTEASSKIQKSRVSRPSINKNLYSTVSLVKAKGKRTKFPRIMKALEVKATEMKDNVPDSLLGLFNHRKIPASKPKTKLETIQVKQIHEMNILVTGQTKSIPSLKTEAQGPENKSKVASEVEKLCLAMEIDMGSSSIGNLKGQQKLGVPIIISMNGEKETQQESSEPKMDGASKVPNYFSFLTTKEKEIIFTNHQAEKWSQKFSDEVGRTRLRYDK